MVTTVLVEAGRLALGTRQAHAFLGALTGALRTSAMLREWAIEAHLACPTCNAPDTALYRLLECPRFSEHAAKYSRALRQRF